MKISPIEIFFLNLPSLTHLSSLAIAYFPFTIGHFPLPRFPIFILHLTFPFSISFSIPHASFDISHIPFLIFFLFVHFSVPISLFPSCLLFSSLTAQFPVACSFFPDCSFPGELAGDLLDGEYDGVELKNATTLFAGSHLYFAFRQENRMTRIDSCGRSAIVRVRYTSSENRFTHKESAFSRIVKNSKNSFTFTEKASNHV